MMTRFIRLLGLLAALSTLPVCLAASAQTPAVRAPTGPVMPVAPRTAAPVAAPAKRIDVNSATAQELDALPGIGPVRAKKIVDNRPYEDIDDLSKKKAISAGELNKIRGMIALANINTSSARDLQKTLPGIGDVRAGQIVAGRPYATPMDLVGKNVLTQALFDKIKDLITF